jgi:hypothetical protein
MPLLWRGVCSAECSQAFHFNSYGYCLDEDEQEAVALKQEDDESAKSTTKKVRKLNFNLPGSPKVSSSKKKKANKAQGEEEEEEE